MRTTRRRSACASAQSDQHLRFRCLDSIIPLVSKSEISSLYLASVVAQPVWVLPGRNPAKTGFLVTRLKFTYHLQSVVYLWLSKSILLSNSTLFHHCDSNKWQRQLNITRNAIGPKSGQKSADNLKLERSSPIWHKWLFVYFIFYLV